MPTSPKTPPRKRSEKAPKAELELSIRYGILAHPGHFIRRLHQISVSVFLKQSEKYDLTQVQYATLATVDFAPGLDQGRLSKLVALDRQTVSNVVKRLCDKGLLLRKQKDGRTNELYLTPKAKALLQSMKRHLASVDETILAPLSARERPAFMKMLMKLVEDNNRLSRAPYDVD